MPYKKTSKKQFWINVKKSFVVGITVLLFDILGHTLFTTRPETFWYYFLKPTISGYVYFFRNKLNFFSIKNKNIFSIYLSLLFSAVHGLYYRLLDWAYGLPFWSRVQDVVIGNIIFSRNNFGSSIMAWGLIHGGAFIISIFIANFLEKKKWLK